MTWNNRSGGLSGTELNVNYIIINPDTKRLNSTSHELWIATDGGIRRSLNGGRDWLPVTLPDPSNAEFGDSPASTVDQLTFHWIDYDPTDRSALYCLGFRLAVNRVWIYKSIDIAVSWSSRGVVTA